MNSNQKSVFIPVLAWILIILGSLYLLGFLVGILVLILLPPFTGMEEELGQLPAIASVVGIVQVLLWAGFTFVSFSLLKRRNWARLTLIGLFGLCFVLTLLWVLLLFFNGQPAHVHQVDPQFQENMKAISQVIAVIFGGVFMALYLWLIKRLCSEPIRAEFLNPPEA